MPELIAAYPEAKIIVCEREVGAWWRSMRATALRAAPAFTDALLYLDGELMRPMAPMFRYQGEVFGGEVRDLFAGGATGEANATRAYRAYHAEVRGLVPEGPRRLEFHLRDGWEPLCKFLGKEVPKGKPFPHVHESRDFIDTETFIKARAWQRVRWTVLQSILRLVVLAVIALGPLLILPREMLWGGSKSG